MTRGKSPVSDEYVEQPGPSEFRDPQIRREFRKAVIWIGTAAAFALIAFLAQPILLILGGLVFATMLDGGARLLNRVLPIARGFRLAIVILSVLGFIGWTVWLTGSQLAEQYQVLRLVVEGQIDRIISYAQEAGFQVTPDDVKGLAQNAYESIGQVTSAVTTVVGVVTSMAMIMVLGIFLAVEPKIYERGFAWMLPLESRAHFYGTIEAMLHSLRRLMAGRLFGMAFEGVGTWLLLMLGGVPMAALLGVITGMLAFIPNIGAIISGALIVLVGFSAGVETGIYAFFVYLAVQMVDGYLIIPMVAKRAVDLAPALVLGAQILLGTLFGILGLALADPIVAMLKVILERQSRRGEPGATAQPAQLEGH